MTNFEKTITIIFLILLAMIWFNTTKYIRVSVGYLDNKKIVVFKGRTYYAGEEIITPTNYQRRDWE